MRVLITGITGYIGSNLARDLMKDCEVYGLVREPLNLTYIEDIKDQLQLLVYDGSYKSISVALKNCQPDVVYHLATHYTGDRGEENTSLLIESNITMGVYLLDAMASCGCDALVYASTVMAHYRGEIYCPLNLYAATKQAFSDLMRYYADAEFLRAVTLILSDTYGPGDKRPKVLNLIKQAAQTGEHIMLSNGEQDYDVVYIDDVVRAFRLAGEQLLQNHGWRNESFQISASKPLTLRQTVEQMLQVNGLALDAAWGGRPPVKREIVRAVRKFPILPGWRPEIALQDGLLRFVQ